MKTGKNSMETEIPCLMAKRGRKEPQILSQSDVESPASQQNIFIERQSRKQSFEIERYGTALVGAL